MKRTSRVLIAFSLVAGVLSGCGKRAADSGVHTEGHDPTATSTETNATSTSAHTDSNAEDETRLTDEGATASSGTAATTTSDGSEPPSSTDHAAAFPGDPLPPEIRQRPNPATATELEACLYFVRSQCIRQDYECVGRTPVAGPCTEITQLCPDLLFSDGSVLTIQTMIECGDKWAQADCEQVVKDEFPGCGLPTGTRPVGAPCRFLTQCESRACGSSGHPDYPDCGMCLGLSPLGGACDNTTTLCEGGGACVEGTCKETTPTAPDEGEICNGTCAYPYYCADRAQNAETRCERRPEVGEPCPFEGCVREGFCRNGICEPDLESGEECTNGSMCKLGAFCDDSVRPSVCAPLREPGQVCSSDPRNTRGNCREDAVCTCDTAACTSESGVCKRLRQVGETCDESSDMCYIGSRCDNGTCVATGLQGLAEGCPP